MEQCTDGDDAPVKTANSRGENLRLARLTGLNLVSRLLFSASKPTNPALETATPAPSLIMRKLFSAFIA